MLNLKITHATWIIVGMLVTGSLSCVAGAVPPPMTMAIDVDNTTANNGAFGFLDGISRSNGMLGNMWGLRHWLGQYGLTLAVQETSEVFDNMAGGLHQRAEYNGLTQVALQLDTQRAFGWYGGTFNVSALNIHGRNFSVDNLGSLQTASGIEADATTRLWEAWYQQKFLDQDRIDVKIGQQSLDQEFMVSLNANYLINTMFGWPMLPSADMPGGGPAYPLSALGLRMRGKPNDSLTFLAGIFNGSPDKNPYSNDSQINNAHGTSFPLGGGVLAIAEVQYAYPALGSMVSAEGSQPLSHLYKLGFWYDSESFSDQQYDTIGRSLADPLSNGNPSMHKDNYAIYAVADQMLWRSENVDDRTLHFFTRIMGTPLTDRNLIDFSLNVGFILHEPFIGRDDDVVGIGIGYAHVSNSVSAFDRAQTTFGTYTPSKTGETYIEATYQYQVTPWWQLQPDFQYVINPGAGALDHSTGGKLGNEAVIGIRTNILF